MYLCNRFFFFLLITSFIFSELLIGDVKAESSNTGYPDLVIDSIELLPYNPIVGRNVIADVIMENAGDADVDVSNVFVRLGLGDNYSDSSTTVWTADVKPGNQGISIIKVGEKQTIRFDSSTVSTGLYNYTDAGWYWANAWVDTTNVVREKGEENSFGGTRSNQLTKNFRVITRADNKYPDLELGYVTVSPGRPIEKELITVFAYLNNTGEVLADLTASVIDIVLDCEDTCGPTEESRIVQYRLDEQISSLDAHSGTKLIFTTDASHALFFSRPGTQSMRVSLDTNNVVVESVEGGNRTIEVSVRSYGEVNAEQEWTDMLNRVRLLRNDNFDALLSKLSLFHNYTQEREVNDKYLQPLRDRSPIISQSVADRIKHFIAYGMDSNTQRLGAGERAAVMYSYGEAFDKLPETEEELSDAVKIANGRWPGQRSEQAEGLAKTYFEQVYKRSPDMGNQNDNAAVTVMAYGLRQRAENRNLDSERQGIRIFKAIFRKLPSTTEEWNIMQAITYSGATR